MGQGRCDGVLRSAPFLRPTPDCRKRCLSRHRTFSSDARGAWTRSTRDRPSLTETPTPAAAAAEQRRAFSFAGLAGRSTDGGLLPPPAPGGAKQSHRRPCSPKSRRSDAGAGVLSFDRTSPDRRLSTTRTALTSKLSGRSTSRFPRHPCGASALGSACKSGRSRGVKQRFYGRTRTAASLNAGVESGRNADSWR
jgi:hypothetical protein